MSYWNRHKETIIQECLALLERNDVNSHIRHLAHSVIRLFLRRARKYIILCVCCMGLNAILLLGVFLISYQNFSCYNIYNGKAFV
jgi:hypothetical protein